jgi:hemoglobin-like flavoprotein
MDLDALETSFDLVAPRGDELMEIFYTRLFETAPAVEPLFAGSDMPRQRQMLLAALVLLRNSLRDFDSVVPALRRLGARHVAYGAQPAHYPVVGAVLIEVAGEPWEQRYADAWGEAFGVIASVMLDGAAEAELPAAA